MKAIRAILLLLALGLPTYGQAVSVTANKIKGSATAPSGACSAQQVQLTTAGVVWVCASGSWASSGGGSIAEISAGNIVDRTSSTTGAISGRRLFTGLEYQAGTKAWTQSAHGLSLTTPKGFYFDSSNVIQVASASATSTLAQGLILSSIDSNTLLIADRPGIYNATTTGLSTSAILYLQNDGTLGTSAGTISYPIAQVVASGKIQYFGMRATSLPTGDYGDITVSNGGATWALDNATVTVAKISATGTPSSSTFLRGDGAWQSAATTNATSGTLPYNNAGTFADSPAVRTSSTEITIGGNLLLNGAGGGAPLITIGGQVALRLVGATYRNVFLGPASGNGTVSGTSNLCSGYANCRALTSGSYNVGFGENTLDAVSTADNNSGFGRASLGAATGSGNTAVGAIAGANVTTASQTTSIGFNARPLSDTDNGGVSINNLITATGATDSGSSYGTGLVCVGCNTTTVPAAKLHALLTDSATNALSTVQIVAHETSGTAAAGFGVATKYILESTTTTNRDAAQIATAWKDATDASRTSLIDFYDVYNAGSLGRLARMTEGRFTLMRAADANPGTNELTALGSSGGASIYIKGSKLVVAYNLAGTINYLTIPLDGSTTTFTATTSAP